LSSHILSIDLSWDLIRESATTIPARRPKETAKNRPIPYLLDLIRASIRMIPMKTNRKVDRNSTFWSQNRSIILNVTKTISKNTSKVIISPPVVAVLDP
jgi:hypothetical protein